MVAKATKLAGVVVKYETNLELRWNGLTDLTKAEYVSRFAEKMLMIENNVIIHPHWVECY